MKTKIILLIACLLTFGSVGLAQKKRTTKPIGLAPEQVVKNLYAAQKAGSGPFFQHKNRALVDRYFTKEFADVIWKDAATTNMNFDPLYYSQDADVKNFTVGKADVNGLVTVKFTNMGKPDEIFFTLTKANTASKVWKIESILYSDAEDLGSLLSNADMTEAEKQAAAAANKLDGDYLVGTVKCSIATNTSGFWARVKCDDRENFQVIDTETLSFGIFNPNEKGRRGKFILRADGTIGEFADASGKKVKVSRIKR